MKKTLTTLFCLSICAFGVSDASAITIKKAAPVATQEASASAATTSLVPTVLNLISGVQQISAKQKELTAECIPTTQEVNFVDNTMKEWAKTGAMSAEEVEKKLGKRCDSATGGYQASVEIAAMMDTDDICYDYFSDAGMVWFQYPKVSVAKYCEDGTNSCSEKKTVSNIYDIFNLIDFSEADYSSSEITMASKLIAKIENCSNSKLNAKKRAMWSEFLMGTISNLGQPTNTGSIMEQVSSIAGSGGGLGSLSSLGAIATQFLGNQ